MIVRCSGLRGDSLLLCPVVFGAKQAREIPRFARNDGGLSRCWKESPLFVEQGWLGDGWSGGLAAGYAYYPEDGDFGEGGSGDEDAVGIGV